LSHLPVDEINKRDCVEVLAALPAESVDLTFTDPPYNLQLHQELWRPNHTRVEAVDDTWDKLEKFEAYGHFTDQWLSACRRVSKRTDTLWVIGTYRNVFRIGKILQDLQYWILNDVIWVETNPMPNFRGVRFTNAHEILIWVQRERGTPYNFNHHAMKALNDDLQMRSDWCLTICSGWERLREGKQRAHPTQNRKPCSTGSCKPVPIPAIWSWTHSSAPAHPAKRPSKTRMTQDSARPPARANGGGSRLVH
jgi:modification methylase